MNLSVKSFHRRRNDLTGEKTLYVFSMAPSGYFPKFECSLPLFLMKTNTMKAFLALILLAAGVTGVFAQADTTSYPKERQEIRELLHQHKPGGLIDCNDFIAVGPKGDISFSHQQWLEVQKTEKLVFKSVQPVPGNEFIRIYEGNIAVVNLLISVQLVVDGRDVTIKVRRLEVYHKNASGWCRVAGQGTQVDETLFPVNSK